MCPLDRGARVGVASLRISASAALRWVTRDVKIFPLVKRNRSRRTQLSVHAKQDTHEDSGSYDCYSVHGTNRIYS
jgi:hypothetical protein